MSLIESDHSIARSPCCWSELKLSTTETRADGKIAWEGEWKCAGCGRPFPHRRGVAFLSILDCDWLTTLSEGIARRKIFQRTLDGVGIPDERRAEHDTQNADVIETMDALFNAALEIIKPHAGMRILDIGAGMCRTSAEFARRGAQVVAAETEASNLLYASFDETHSGAPPQIDIHGQKFYESSPERYPNYFSRVVAPAHRLPFAEASFDVVFCRSVLHHFHDLSRAIREMLRVLKPGGLFCACSEPTRSVLDSEDSYLIGGIDKEEGFNEQVPTLIDYWRGLNRNAERFRVQAWAAPHQFRSKKIFRWIPYNYHRHLREGEIVGGVKILKLLPVSTGSNLFARRNLFPIPPPHCATDLLRNFSTADLARINTPATLEKSVQDYRTDTETLSAARRELAAICAPPGAMFVPALCRERDLRVGWRMRVNKLWELARFTNQSAEVTLAIPPHAEKLQMRCAAPSAMADPSGSTPIAGSVLVNGKSIAEYSLAAAAGWQLFSFPLPVGLSGVSDIEIANAHLVRSLDEGQPRELGVAVQWIRLV